MSAVSHAVRSPIDDNPFASHAETRYVMHKRAVGRAHSQETKDKIRRSQLAVSAKQMPSMWAPIFEFMLAIPP